MAQAAGIITQEQFSNCASAGLVVPMDTYSTSPSECPEISPSLSLASVFIDTPTFSTPVDTNPGLERPAITTAINRKKVLSESSGEGLFHEMSGMNTNLNVHSGTQHLIDHNQHNQQISPRILVGGPPAPPVSTYIIGNYPTNNNNNFGQLSSTYGGPLPPGGKHTVHWFRRGLRLHDNPSLREGIRNSTTFRCVFILDPWFAGSSNVGINKWRFLLQCLEDLDQSLRKLNSRLFVIRGQPADVLPKLFKEWGTTTLTFEEDPEPFGRVRDQNIMAQCKELDIDVIVRSSHTLYKLDVIIDKNGGQAPLTYRHFQNIIATLDPPPLPEPTITLEFIHVSYTPISDDHDEKYGVPTLEELGFETDNLRSTVWKGGETEALARLERHLERKAWVASFGRPKMTPQSLLASQTGVSAYLRFGCLSTRLFYYQLSDLFRKIKRTDPPLSLHGQILWREFFYCAATKNSNFDRMKGNSICVQIPWDKNSEALAKWANGQTGFPWIDAIMTQLREEGWIHHLARHAVACFLTRGDLWISWEEGMKVFEELLLDADWSVNAGMWMWLSCSSFFQQFFHCYCPVRFGRKADPNGDYIRSYLPVLKNMPNRYIHEPWMAPESVQKASKCIIGKDYPMPMINHAVAARVNIERMKQVYHSLAKYRDDSASLPNQEKGLNPTPEVQITLQEPNSNFTTLDDSMVNTAAAAMDMQCDLSTKSLHELLESAINETFGSVG